MKAARHILHVDTVVAQERLNQSLTLVTWTMERHEQKITTARIDVIDKGNSRKLGGKLCAIVNGPVKGSQQRIAMFEDEFQKMLCYRVEISDGERLIHQCLKPRVGSVQTAQP